MREYGQIQVNFWTHPDIYNLSDQAKLLAVYLVASPHSNALGCYRIPFGYCSEDLKWGKDTVSKRFTELGANGFAFICNRTDWVLIPNFLKWNPIANPKCASHIEKLFDIVPKEFSLYPRLCKSLILHGHHLKEPFINRIETVLKGFPEDETQSNKPFRYRARAEQEQEQEQEQEHILCPSKLDDDDSDFDIFWKQYPARGVPPTREKRKDALKRWRSLKKGNTLPEMEVILARLDIAKKSNQWQNSKYIPLASSWLNDEPWKDDPPIQQQITPPEETIIEPFNVSEEERQEFCGRVEEFMKNWPPDQKNG